jgi:hypothetical protein
MDPTAGAPVTGGFARHGSGLFVPEELKRERETWTYDDWKVLERATKLLSSRGLMLFLGCPEEGCKGREIERIRNLDGGITLRCNHKDRVVVRFRRG